MIAIAILSLGLATVFGSSILASRGTAHARFVTQGALLARCRMTEIEVYLRVNQLPETDQVLEDPPDRTGEQCCQAPYTCTARVDRIELPQPADVSTRAGDRLLQSGANAARQGQGGTTGGDGGAGGGGAFGALAGAMSALSGPAGAAGGSGALGGLAGNGAPNLQGMATELLAGIYPTLKPVLEGAIRRVTVTVSWNEGTRPFSFDVVQYVTNPGQTIASGDALEAAERRAGGQTPGTQTPGTQTPTTPTTPTLPIPGLR